MSLERFLCVVSAVRLEAAGGSWCVRRRQGCHNSSIAERRFVSPCGIQFGVRCPADLFSPGSGSRLREASYALSAPKLVFPYLNRRRQAAAASGEEVIAAGGGGAQGVEEEADLSVCPVTRQSVFVLHRFL